MTVEQLQEKIKDYLDGQLPPGDQKAFEQDIQASEPLAEEVRRYRQLRILSKNAPLIQGKAMLNNIMDEHTIEPDYGQYESYFKKSLWEHRIWRWLSGLLVLAVIAGGTFYYQQAQEKQALTALADDQLRPLENMIGFAADDQSTAAMAMRAYDQRNYSSAIAGLQTAIQESPDDNSLRLYLAVSHLLLQQHSEAESLLRELTQTDDLTTIPAKWYLALSLVQRGEKEKARILLQSIRTDTVFGERAGEVMKGLER